MDEFEGFAEDVRTHLSEQGSDLTLPHNLDLYLYYPSAAAAHEVAAVFHDSPSGPRSSSLIRTGSAWFSAGLFLQPKTCRQSPI